MSLILVTGATGQQGGATARALLEDGHRVRALVRDPDSDRARRIGDAGAELVRGDLLDPSSIRAAVEGVDGVFSVQMPNGVDPRNEWEQGSNLIRTAAEAGVSQFVHTSVSGAGQHRTEAGWAEGRWAAMENYYETKAGLQELVRDSGFRTWTVLKPATFMENFLPTAFMFPRGLEGGLISLVKPETVVALIAVADIGAAAAAAFGDPERFDSVELEFAGDRLSMREVAAVLSQAWGTDLTAPDLTADQARALGMPEFGTAHERQNVVGQPAYPEDARRLGLAPISFAAWAALQPDRSVS